VLDFVMKIALADARNRQSLVIEAAGFQARTKLQHSPNDCIAEIATRLGFRRH
jgi:hypothetical protein